MSQCQRVLDRLRKAPLTQLEAISEIGVARLGARVLELRQQGHSISTEMMTVKNRFGDESRVGRYRLVREARNG
ncbi:MAG: Bcep22 gp24 [Burkholderiaceae bacterium]|nr:Bcep22 gp24 [Burkholderiaceae bacterium]